MKEAFKNKKILVAIVTIILTVIVVGVSYAYFSAIVDETNKTETVIQTKKLSITFEGTNEIYASNIVPGWSGEKRFSVENTSTSKTIFSIFMENITNGFGSDLKYTLYETDSTGNTIISTLVDNEILPQTNIEKEYLKNDIEINAAPTKKYYKMVINFEYKNTPQNDYQGSSFRSTVGIEAGVRKDVAIVTGETINASSLTSGDTITREFQIFNYANETKTYDLGLDDVVNTYASGLTYSLTKNGTEVISNQAMPTANTTLLSKQSLASGATDKYVMTITYDTSNANVDGFKLLENEINTFSANLKTEVIEIYKNFGSKVDISSITDEDTVTKTFSVTNYTSSTKTYSINLNEIAENYTEVLEYELKKNNEIIASGSIEALNTSLVSNVSLQSGATDEYEIEIVKPGYRCLGNDCPKCIRATQLHTSGNTTYGNATTTEGQLKAGDAFDCDVNKDGRFSKDTERFYYVSDYYDTSTKTFNSEYAALIYYQNYGSFAAYNASKGNYPTTILDSLPTVDEWSNVSLLATTRRVLTDDGTVVKSNLNYVNSNNETLAARLLTRNEKTSAGEKSFFRENIPSGTNPGYWEETMYKTSSHIARVVTRDTFNGQGYTDTTNRFGARPVIDVAKTDIQY